MEMILFALAILFFALAWMNLSLAIGILLALLPSYLLRASLFGIPTTLLELMLVSVVAVWLIQNRHRLRELFVLNKTWAMAIALVIVAATVSAIITPNVLQALGIYKAYFIEPILLFYVLKDLLARSVINAEHLKKYLLLGGTWVAFAAVAQWIFNTGIPIPWDIERRVTGVFDYPNALGLYLGPLTIIAITNLTNFLDKRKWIYLSCAGLFTFAMVLAKSEAALAALMVTLILLGLSQPIWRKKTAAVAVVLVIISFALPFSRSYLIEKIAWQDSSEQVRISQWKETWELLKDHSILGVGLSGFPSALVPYHRDTHLEIFQYPHNIFLNIWVELGLLGLIAFFMLTFLVVRLRRVCAVFPLLLMFLHGLVDVPYFKNDLAVLTWVFIALLYAEHFFKNKA